MRSAFSGRELGRLKMYIRMLAPRTANGGEMKINSSFKANIEPDHTLLQSHLFF